jgi:hypothetical protein
MQFRRSLSLTAALVTVLIHTPAASQVIDFETGGLRYKTLSKGGFTVMFAPLPTTIRNYAVLQVAVANGSGIAWPVKPEDFRFERADGTSIQAVAASRVISELLDKGGRNDVIKLVSTYEAGLYGLPRFQSTNGYQVRRQHALAEVQSTRIKAAAAASAIAFVPVKLNPGQVRCSIQAVGSRWARGGWWCARRGKYSTSPWMPTRLGRRWSCGESRTIRKAARRPASHPGTPGTFGTWCLGWIRGRSIACPQG